MKSPSTATFRNASEQDGEVLITNFAEPDPLGRELDGRLTEQFGATIRTRFRCSVYDRGDQWELESVEFLS